MDNQLSWSVTSICVKWCTVHVLGCGFLLVGTTASLWLAGGGTCTVQDTHLFPLPEKASLCCTSCGGSLPLSFTPFTVGLVLFVSCDVLLYPFSRFMGIGASAFQAVLPVKTFFCKCLGSAALSCIPMCMLPMLRPHAGQLLFELWAP
jgi:hypothetical protein